MSLIILDGMNNVGKSTLCEWAVANFGIPSYHHAGPEQEEAEFVRTNLKRWGRSPDCAIFDRFYFTYLAYPSTGNWRWGRSLPPSVTEEFRAETEADLRALLKEGNLLLFHASIPLEKIWEYEIGLNPAVEVAKEDFRVLRDAFADVLRDWDPHPYDYTNPASVEAAHEAIARFLA